MIVKALPEGFEYFVLLQADDVPDMKATLTLVATHPNATIQIGGLYGSRIRSGDTFRSGLRLGENKAGPYSLEFPFQLDLSCSVLTSCVTEGVSA